MKYEKEGVGERTKSTLDMKQQQFGILVDGHKAVLVNKDLPQTCT
jgi:hypothetical protein